MNTMSGAEMRERAQNEYGWGWQRKLADELGVSVATLRRVQNRDPLPRIYQLAVSKLFGLPYAA
jgi:hypothetical protein